MERTCYSAFDVAHLMCKPFSKLNFIMRDKKYKYHIMAFHQDFGIPEFSQPLTGATFTLHRVFYCVARTWVVIGCQRDLLLLG